MAHAAGTKPIFSLHSFKTKGNLTKHMKSKAHYKKCVELGLNPLPTSVDEDYGLEDEQEDSSMTSSCAERTSNNPDGDDDSDSDDMSDGEDGENESSGEFASFWSFF